MSENQDKLFSTSFLTVFSSGLWSVFLKIFECELIIETVMSQIKMLVNDL